MAGRFRTPSLRLKLFLTVNAVFVLVTAAGLAIDVPRQYRSYHRLLYEQLLDDARVAQQAWVRTSGREVIFRRDPGLVEVVGEDDSRRQCLAVIGPAEEGQPASVLVCVPTGASDELRGWMLDHAREPHAMGVVGGRRMMAAGLAVTPLPNRRAVRPPPRTSTTAPWRGGLGKDQRIVIARDVGELYGFIKQEMLSRAGFVVVSVLWVMVIINLLLNRWVARPVHRLSEAADRLGRGDYTGAIGTQWGTEELNSLARSFEDARHRLADAQSARLADLDRARRTQRALLPRMQHPINGLSIAADYRPAEHVGGDFYDVQQTADGQVVVMIGDPTGHGVPAALMMAVVKMDLAHLAPRSAGPGGLAAMTRQLARDLAMVCQPTDFVTFMAVQLAPGGGPARYLNAGHVPGRLLRADGSVALLEPTGPLIADMDHDGWQEIALPVAPGDRLVLVTDGLLDAENASGEMFGADRLDGLLAETRGQSPSDVVDRVQEELVAWVIGGRRGDDITVVVVDCVERGAT